MSQFNRRDSLKSLAALASAATLGGWSTLAQAQKPLTVGVIYVGPRDDYGYNQAHAQAAAELKKLPGIKLVEEENVPETAAVQKTMTGMIAQDGAKLLFPTSFGSRSFLGAKRDDSDAQPLFPTSMTTSRSTFATMAGPNIAVGGLSMWKTSRRVR